MFVWWSEGTEHVQHTRPTAKRDTFALAPQRLLVLCIAIRSIRFLWLKPVKPRRSPYYGLTM